MCKNKGVLSQISQLSKGKDLLSDSHDQWSRYQCHCSYGISDLPAPQDGLWDMSYCFIDELKLISMRLLTYLCHIGSIKHGTGLSLGAGEFLSYKQILKPQCVHEYS